VKSKIPGAKKRLGHTLDETESKTKQDKSKQNKTRQNRKGNTRTLEKLRMRHSAEFSYCGIGNDGRDKGD
jgi:hypothetical protein